jgi:hypothetical protein
LNKPLFLDFSNRIFTVTIVLHAATFDLPAQASILRHRQYNGLFGCLFCKNPGEVIESGREHAHIYKHGNYENITSAMQKEYSQVADLSNDCIFGFLGSTKLSKWISVPVCILIDARHLMYENIMDKFLLSALDTKYQNEEFFVGRPAKRAQKK